MRSGYPLLAVLGIATLGAVVVRNAPPNSPRDESEPSPLFASISRAFSRADSDAEPYTDHRAWQHGIDIVKVGDRHLLVWSSWGDTPHPTSNPEGNWEHDVYRSWLDPENPEVKPEVLVTAPEAQEPASTAINSRGHIIMSCEDGNPDISQRMGMWSSDLTPVKAYGELVHDGGHSGHVTALGDRFVVAYAEGWIDGGGVDNLGTGDDIWARVINDDGSMSRQIPVSVNKAEDHRDWWPVVSASDSEALEVWQRYPSGTLWGAFIKPDGTASAEFQITDNIKYYFYNVKWIPSLDRYAVFGSRNDGGFISLIDRTGKAVAEQTGLPDSVRESKLIVREDKNGVTAVYPALPTGAAVVYLTDQSIKFDRALTGDYEWDYMGTDGMFISPHRLLFATLSKTGVQLIKMSM